jgi:8-oxo-dGTP pyrophosphatase MutT (NUDIX family)
MKKTDDHDILWRETGRMETVWTSPIFNIDKVQRLSPEGDEYPFMVCRTPDWVTIIPELQNGDTRDFVMVRQFRHGSGALSMEFPAGVVDPGEEALTAAVRELREETGYIAQELIPIGRINPNPAFMSNTSWTFLARGLKKSEELDLDEQEFITAHKISEKDVDINMGTGEYDNAIMVQSWYWYKRFINSKS